MKNIVKWWLAPVPAFVAVCLSGCGDTGPAEFASSADGGDTSDLGDNGQADPDDIADTTAESDSTLDTTSDAGTDADVTTAADLDADVTTDAGVDADAPTDIVADASDDATTDADAVSDTTSVTDTTTDADVVPAPTVSVITPLAGRYTLGSSLQVAWESSDADTVTLSLMTTAEPCSEGDAGVVVPDLFSSSAITTTYTWEVPTTLAPADYRVRVRATSMTGVSSVACSAVFSLVQPPGCSELGCAAQNRVCTTDAGVAECAGCVDGFTDVDGVCVVVDCGATPAAPSNATLAGVSTTRFGGVATYTCLEGYTTTGLASASATVTRRCGSLGVWEEASGECYVVSCRGLTPPANGNVSTPDGVEYNDVAAYTCNSGYELTSGSSSRVCDVTGVWTGSPAVCTAVDCGGLPNPLNGSVVLSEGALRGAVASYSCALGFVLQGSATRTCSDTGLWSGEPPTCAPVDCGEPPVVENGERTVFETTLGNSVRYVCNTGYTPVGTATVRCEATGLWTSAPTCMPLDCGVPPAIENGERTFVETTLASSASYTCNAGYELVGDATIGCTITGFWAPAPNCSPVDCGEPPVIEHGECTFAETTLGSSASCTCNAGYAPVGAATISCATTGSWTTAPNCEDINECVAAATVCDEANNVCTNREGNWECSCDEGYIGMPIVGGNTSCLSTPPEGLGAACIDNSDCPTNSWCSTVSGFRVCSPRVFGGAAHQMDFVFVPSAPSGYQQGTLGATNNERPYTATISRNYFVSRTEVTQGQWKAATGGMNGSCFQSTTGTSCTTSNANNNGPVEQVDWYSTLAYANWLSVNQGLSACYTLTPSTCADAVSDWATGDTACTGATFTGLTCTGYRLLTESEWERAARGGTTSTYYWGTATDTATVGLYAWFIGNAGSRTQSVGGKQANGYGLHDMSGNGREWVWDWVGDWVSISSAWIPYPSGSATDYIGGSSGSFRGIRGGSWSRDVSFLRSANRNFTAPSSRDDNVGFRLTRTAN